MIDRIYCTTHERMWFIKESVMYDIHVVWKFYPVWLIMNCDTILEQAILENGLIDNPSREKDMLRKKRFMDSIKKSPLHCFFFTLWTLAFYFTDFAMMCTSWGGLVNAFEYAIADGSF